MFFHMKHLQIFGKFIAGLLIDSEDGFDAHPKCVIADFKLEDLFKKISFYLTL